MAMCISNAGCAGRGTWKWLNIDMVWIGISLLVLAALGLAYVVYARLHRKSSAPTES